MGDQHKPLKDLSQSEATEFVDHYADEYRSVLTVRETRDFQTGAVAIFEKPDGDRVIMIINSGLRTEKPGAGDGKTGLVQTGPYQKTIGGKKYAYTRDSDGNEVIYDPKTSNDHHAEPKLIAFEESSGYKLVAAAPTRGCCGDCQTDMKERYGEEGFKKMVPDHRQSPEAFNRHRAEIEAAQKNQPNAVATKPDGGQADNTGSDLPPAVSPGNKPPGQAPDHLEFIDQPRDGFLPQPPSAESYVERAGMSEFINQPRDGFLPQPPSGGSYVEPAGMSEFINQPRDGFLPLSDNAGGNNKGAPAALPPTIADNKAPAGGANVANSSVANEGASAAGALFQNGPR
jgi:hypothetical protein